MRRRVSSYCCWFWSNSSHASVHHRCSGAPGHLPGVSYPKTCSIFPVVVYKLRNKEKSRLKWLVLYFYRTSRNKSQQQSLDTLLCNVSVSVLHLLVLYSYCLCTNQHCLLLLSPNAKGEKDSQQGVAGTAAASYHTSEIMVSPDQVFTLVCGARNIHVGSVQ